MSIIAAHPSSALWVYLSLLFIAVFPFNLHAQLADALREQETASSPGYPCVGYLPPTDTWGWKELSHHAWNECPPGYAFFGVERPFGKWEAEDVPLHGNCCRLPAGDILTEEHLITRGACPDGYVITGMRMVGVSYADCPKDCGRKIRCTKINQKDYALGPIRKGVHWGVNSSAAFPWKEKKSIRRNQIPLAIRYGVARQMRARVGNDGCVGDPIGSLLIGARALGCVNTLWREVFKVLDRGEKKRMQMYPECKDISSVFSPDPKCRD